MARTHRHTTDKGRPGLAPKAAEASAARLAARMAVSEGVAGNVNVCPTPSGQCISTPSGQHTSMPSGRRTSPRHPPNSNSPPAESSPSSGLPNNDVAVSWGQRDSDSSSGKSSSSGDAADPDYVADDSTEHGEVDAEAFDSFLHNNNENENDAVEVGAMNEVDDLNDCISSASMNVLVISWIGQQLRQTLVWLLNMSTWLRRKCWHVVQYPSHLYVDL